MMVSCASSERWPRSSFDEEGVGGDEEALAEVGVEVAVAGEHDQELVLRLELAVEIFGELGEDLVVGGILDLFDVEVVEGGEGLVDGVGVERWGFEVGPVGVGRRWRR
jgi:hypothetical protein